ncbi:MAG: class II aldolase/adducin family protein [Eubacteriales bacterium]|nr:class II aldolase/adducin family protein [Eubacteriales bacterium]
MTKPEAIQIFLEIAAQLRHEQLLNDGMGVVKAALRGDDGMAYYARLYGASANDLTVQECRIEEADEPFLRAFFIKPEAKALLLLCGTYALRIAETSNYLTAELDDMAQIVGLTARVAKSLSESELSRCLKNRNSCFVRNQGMLLTGRAASEAMTGAILLEKAAMTHILAKQIGGAKRVPLFSAALMHSIYQKKYSKINLEEESVRAEAKQPKPAAEQPERSKREQELCEAIVACGIRLVDEGLVQGTWGNIAVRLDETSMLCTPSGLAYHYLTPDDIVKVDLATLEFGSQRKPTSEKRLHRDLFAARPDVGASIHTHAKRCGVFAAACKTLCCISGEMKELVGAEMRCAGHALPSTKKLSKVALSALENRNGCLLMNHGVLCCGSDLEQAYRACKAAEQAAGEQLGLE